MNPEELHAIRQNILERISASLEKAKSCGIGMAEIYASYVSGSSITLEKNDIQTLDTHEKTVYGIRVIEKGCEGFVTTNNGEDLLSAIEEARKLATIQNTSDECLELPPPPLDPTPPIDRLDDSLFRLEPSSILNIAGDLLRKKESLYPKVSLDSCEVSYGFRIKAIGSTLGILRSEARSSIDASFMGMAIDGEDIGSFDYDSAYGESRSEFEKNLDERYNRFLESCMGGLGAISISGFKGYVFLPPDSIFSFLFGGLLTSLSATSIRMKRSKMEGKLGESIVHPEISIFCKPTDRRLPEATSFDREGQNTRDLTLIEKGVLKEYLYNHYEARKAGLPCSNGYATGGSGAPPGCGPIALEIAPGRSSRKNLEDPDGKCIWVNRFSGTGSSASGDFSGVIKGGFLLENGEKTPVKEIQIAGNLYELLKSGIAGISEERELIGHSTWAPAILLEGVTITGK